MDFNKLVARAKNILLSPKTEWPVISAEPETVVGLYKNYIVILAAIPVVASFIKLSLIGTGWFGLSYREGIGSGIVRMVVTYAVTLGLVYVSSLIANALATNFGAQKDPMQALKAVVYGWTASWIAGAGALLGTALGALIGIAGLVYAIFLLNMGLKETMKCPPDRAAEYTAATVALTIVVSIVASTIIFLPLGLSLGMGGFGNHGHFSTGDGEIKLDKDSALGALAAMGQRAQEASKKMEAAQQSGDAKAQTAAAGEMLGAVLGGGQVEALAPDALKPFLPDTLGGLSRTSFSVQRQSAIGLQVSVATAAYRDTSGAKSYELTVTDAGGAKTFLAMAGFANLEEEKQSDSGYEKTYRQGGHLIHERWDKSGSGEYTVVLGDRFIVALKGSGLSGIDALKAAMAGMNLAGLEALKTQGVKNG